jgi:hypothetical protein
MPSDAISRSLRDIDRPWAGDEILWAPMAGEPLAGAVQERAPDTLRRARPHRLEA